MRPLVGMLAFFDRSPHLPPEPSWAQALTPAPGRNPLLDNLGIGHGGLKQLVAGSKGIKRHVGVWQQVLPVSRGQSDRVSEHLERIRLGQLCNGVKTAKRN